MWLTLLHIAFKFKGQVQAKLFGVKSKNDITSLFAKCLEDKAVGEVPSLSLSLSLSHTHILVAHLINGWQFLWCIL